MKDTKRILTTKQMYSADAKTISSGIYGIDLMLNAGKAVFDEIVNRWHKCSVLILCGAGNNGGDGFIVAKLLQDAGWSVHVMSLIDKNSYKGDAKLAAEMFKGKIYPISLDTIPKLAKFGLVVDAVFGIGFTREISKNVAKIFDAINNSKIPVIAVDIPSGIDGDSGKADKHALKADLTVSFCCKKTGHLLGLGRSYAGEIKVANIGILKNTYKDKYPKIYENSKEFWLNQFPKIQQNCHKYDRGHSVIYGGSKMTGAAKLAANAAARIGSGLTSIIAKKELFSVYASYMPSLIIEPINSIEDVIKYLKDERLNSILIGPGAGVGEKIKEHTLKIISSAPKSRNFVIDADAISSFENDTKKLFSLLNNNCVLTPHMGEFKKIFKNLVNSDDTKTNIALKAAKITNSVIVLKGSDTVIATPDNIAVINTNAPAYLATAGSGDVLAGMIVGLMAQKMPPFKAACAAVWLHSEAANLFGRGLIADDIAKQIPSLFKKHINSN